VARAAKENGIWAGICGELAADLELSSVFVDMGYDELSVSPGFTLSLRKRIRELE
jgi:phosphotransferase system enzyme I (PtsI)